MKQHTLKSSFSFEGKGLHTGVYLHTTFLPAEANTGIRICRSDLEGRPTYEAIADYVTATERGTVLERGAWKVSTVEHALSALYALGVDNCLIEVDGPEMPILDGSAKFYVKAIQEVGLQEQDAEQKVFVVTEPIEYISERGSKMMLIVNGVGATTHMELSIVFRKAYKELEARGLQGAYSRIQEILTVQEQAGFQMIIAKLDDDHIDYLKNYAANTPYWTTIGK